MSKASSALSTGASSSSAGSGSSGLPGAGATASVIPTSPIAITNQITVKLTAENYLFWLTQVVLILRSNLLFGFVDGSLPCPDEKVPESAGSTTMVSNPQFAAWHQQDQAILSAINCSLSEGVLGMMMMISNSRDAWEMLEGSFVSQTMARAMHIRGEMNQTKKLGGSATAFFNKIKGYADTLASIGMPLRPEEFSGYLCQGLDGDYDALVQLVSSRAVSDPMPVKDIYSQLLATEQRVDARRAELTANTQMMAHYSACPGSVFPSPHPGYVPRSV